MRQLAGVLVQRSPALGSCMPRLLAAAALELHAAAHALLQGCFGPADANADLVQLLLEGLHEALQHSGHADGVVRGSIALRLVAFLEQQQHHLDRALAIVKQVCPLLVLLGPPLPAV
jgi:hypothetical protein